MKIGFYFECSKRSGGVYQYALNLLSILRELPEHEFTVFNLSADFPFEEYKLLNWKIVNLLPVDASNKTDSQRSEIKKTSVNFQNFYYFYFKLRRKLNLLIISILRKLRMFSLEQYLAGFNARKRAKIFEFYELDLMIFHGPSELSLLISIPSILPIHDIQHRINPHFPEVSQQGQMAKREHLVKNIVNRTHAILVPADINKKDLVEMYGASPDRVHVARPFSVSYINDGLGGSDRENVAKKYNLPQRFLFYPAQFWPHKNHKNLILATAKLRDEGVIVPLVFSGARQDQWGEFERLVKLVDERNLDRQVYFIGYIDNADLCALYKMAEGIAVPTFLGPIQFPVIEGWRANRPVLCSSARGSLEEIGDGALFFDPSDHIDIAEKIRHFWGNDELQRKLAERGICRSKLWSRDKYSQTLKSIISDFELSCNTS